MRYEARTSTVPRSIAAKFGRPSGRCVVRTSPLSTPNGEKSSPGALRCVASPLVQVTVGRLNECPARQGTVPDGFNVPVLACLSFHAPLVVTVPCPAARLVPRSDPWHRRSQPRARATRIVGRHIIARVRTAWRHNIHVRIIVHLTRDTQHIKTWHRNLQQLRRQAQLGTAPRLRIHFTGQSRRYDRA